MMPAQDFRGAALDGEFRRGLDRERQLMLQRLAVGGVLLDKGGEVADAVRQLLLPDRADVLDDGGFHHRLLAGLQHARHRHRHAPHGVQLRDEPGRYLRRCAYRAWRRPHGTSSVNT